MDGLSDAVGSLLRSINVLGADVRFRTEELRVKCDEIERIYNAERRRLEDQDRARKMDAETKKREADHHRLQTERMQNSLESALERARSIRGDKVSSKLASNMKPTSVLSNNDQVEMSTQLDTILTMAQQAKSSPQPIESDNNASNYMMPRSLRRAIRTYQEDILDEGASPVFRHDFAKKMNEHLNASNYKVQVGYREQVHRLSQAYKRLAMFLDERKETSSVLRTQASRRLVRELDTEMNRLGKQCPPPPIVSQEAHKYHQAALFNLRSKRQSSLLASKAQEPAQAQRLNKLEQAWQQSVQDNDAGKNDQQVDAFSDTVFYIVLTDVSEVILEEFKKVYAEGPLDDEHMKGLLRLIQFADSVCRSKGRAVSSVIAS